MQLSDAVAGQGSRQAAETAAIFEEATRGKYWYSLVLVSLAVSDLLVRLLGRGALDAFLYAAIGQAPCCLDEAITATMHPLHRKQQRPSACRLKHGALTEATLVGALLGRFHAAWIEAQPENILAFGRVFAHVSCAFEREHAAPLWGPLV